MSLSVAMSVYKEAEEEAFISFTLLAALWCAQREEGEGRMLST